MSTASKLIDELVQINPRNINGKCFFCGITMGMFGYESHTDTCLWQRTRDSLAKIREEEGVETPPKKKSMYG